MCRNLALLLVLIFLASSGLVTLAKPALSSDVVAENTWKTRASMQQARAGLGVVAVNGKIYAIGGTLANGFYDHFVGTNEVYDPATDKWIYKASMPTPRASFAIAAYKNKVYCMGGVVGSAFDDQMLLYYQIESNVFEVYDTITNTWETKKPLPYAEMNIQASVVNGKIYVVGEDFTCVYDPEDDSWTFKNQMSIRYPVSAAVDNKIIATGVVLTNHPTGAEQKIMIYDTKTDSWSEGTPGPTVVAVGAAGATTGVKAPQRVYVLGLGNQQYPPPSTSLVYDPKIDSWSTAASMPTHRQDFGIVVLDDILYAFGGHLYSGQQVTGANEQYIPFGYGTTDPNHAQTAEATTSENTQTEETFPTTVVAVTSGASAIAITTGLLVYSRKRAKSRENITIKPT